MSAEPAETPRVPPTPRAPEHTEPGRADASRRFSIVCLSPQNWDVDLPTNRQQIMLRAKARGHDVLFVETGPFVGRHLRELAGPRRRSVLRQLLSSELVAPEIRVAKAPNLAPWGHKYGLASRVNAALTALAIRRLARRLPQPRVLWLYDPCLAPAVGRCGEAFAVYDCVDDYAEQAGRDDRKRAFVAAADRLAAARSRLVFATATTLFERHRSTNAHTHLVRNVGDYAHFRSAADPAFAAADVAGLPRPVVGFAGNFLQEKVDFDLLEAVAEARPGWTILLVGPSRPETEERLTELAARRNVRWVGAKPYVVLPRYVAAFDVAVIPYVTNAYTRSCFPLKTFECLAAGKPVVASGLPELAGMEPHVVLAEGRDAFVAAVEAALGQLGDADRETRQAVAAGSTWDTRAERLLGLVADEL